MNKDELNEILKRHELWMPNLPGEDKKINRDELNEMLKKYESWLYDLPGVGEQVAKLTEVMRGADLGGAYLRGVDLSGADLEGE